MRPNAAAAHALQAACRANPLPPPAVPAQHYELHRNDCRHYINCLVRYTTGQEQAASACLAAQWQRARERGTYGLATRVVRLTQFFTDLANWGKVQVRRAEGRAWEGRRCALRCWGCTAQLRGADAAAAGSHHCRCRFPAPLLPPRS